MIKLYKTEDGGTWRWIASYTNSLMDDSTPRDIITSDAHRLAVARYESGAMPLPPLAMWHEMEWKIGETDSIFLDEVDDTTVFVIATGTIDKDKEFVVPYLDEMFHTMSHGLVSWKYTTYVDSGVVTRDIEDYTTVEISVLPDRVSAPANPFTYFGIGEDQMAIKREKRAALAEVLPEEILDTIEGSNQSIAQEAKASNVQHKDITMDTQEEVVVSADVAEDTAVATETQTEEEVVTDLPSKSEVDNLNDIALRVAGVLKESLIGEFADAAASLLKASLDDFTSRLAQVEDAVNTISNHVGETDKSVAEIKSLGLTPSASFQDHILKSFVAQTKGASNAGDEKDTAPTPKQASASNSPIDSMLSKILGGN